MRLIILIKIYGFLSVNISFRDSVPLMLCSNQNYPSKRSSYVDLHQVSTPLVSGGF